MLKELLDNDKFRLLMKMHVYECVDLLLQNDIDFSIVANLAITEFEPALPDEIMANFTHPAIVFALGGYTFESAVLTQDMLSFEAGFGTDDFASLVKVPLEAIVQIMVDDSAVMINFATPRPKKQENSMSIFKSNPKNDKIFRKK